MTVGGTSTLAIPIISDVWGAFTGVFSDIAGWAVDSVITAITTWIVSGVLAVIEALWSVIDATSDPAVDAEWFAGDASSPFELALGIGAAMMMFTMLAAVVRAVINGSPGGVAKAVAVDLPSAIFVMFATISFTAVSLDLTNAMSDFVWAGTRDDAAEALESLTFLLRSGLPGTHFLGVFLALALLAAMLFLWIVLYVREALIYLVVVFSAAFAWPMMVFPPLRDTAKKAFELLVALIICKPVITLAMSVGISAMAAIGETGGDVDLGKSISLLVVGVMVFGMAAFMPFLVWKLMPLVASAVIAQGVASAPMRGAQQGMQMQFYAKQLGAGGRIHGASGPTSSNWAGGVSSGPGGPTSASGPAAAGTRTAGATTKPAAAMAAGTVRPNTSAGTSTAPAGGRSTPVAAPSRRRPARSVGDS